MQTCCFLNSENTLTNSLFPILSVIYVDMFLTEKHLFHVFSRFKRHHLLELLGKIDSVYVQIHRNGDALRNGYIICFATKFSFVQHDCLNSFPVVRYNKPLKVPVSSVIHYVQAYLRV